MKPPESPANPSSPIGNVHGLGESHALRIDLRPIQVPWLAHEVETLRAVVSLILRRDDQIGCPTFATVDAWELRRTSDAARRLEVNR